MSYPGCLLRTGYQTVAQHIVCSRVLNLLNQGTWTPKIMMKEHENHEISSGQQHYTVGSEKQVQDQALILPSTTTAT